MNDLHRVTCATGLNAVSSRYTGPVLGLSALVAGMDGFGWHRRLRNNFV